VDVDPVESIVEHIDMNAAAPRFDSNALMAGVDLDALVAKVDINAVLDRVDPDATCEVYDWGDRPAELPAPLTAWIERRPGQ
jgi:hypothetical protein